jgi:hypothetical protein
MYIKLLTTSPFESIHSLACSSLSCVLLELLIGLRPCGTAVRVALPISTFQPFSLSRGTAVCVDSLLHLISGRLLILAATINSTAVVIVPPKGAPPLLRSSRPPRGITTRWQRCKTWTRPTSAIPPLPHDRKGTEAQSWWHE